MSEPEICQACKEEFADSTCEECGMEMCTSCDDAHICEPDDEVEDDSADSGDDE